MKKVYTRENRLLVWNAKNVLEAENIDCEVLNEFAIGGVGVLSAFDAWPELWIKNDSDLEHASLILEKLKAPVDDGEIKCSHCGEINPSGFNLCWNCQSSLP